MDLNKGTIAFRRAMVSDITALRNLLYKVGINFDSSGLDRASSSLQDEKHIPFDKTCAPTPTAWGYDSEEISFSLERVPDGVIPKVDNLKVILKAKVIGTYLDGSEEAVISVLENNIIVRGYIGDEEFICTYHLDKHISTDEEAEYPHPYFHIHFGGKEMDKNNKKYGELLLIDSPRMVHLPMELILGVDFILSNFMPDKWRTLREDGEYVNLHKHYQKLFWKPYIQAIAKHWSDYSDVDHFDSIQLIPQLVPCES